MQTFVGMAIMDPPPTDFKGLCTVVCCVLFGGRTAGGSLPCTGLSVSGTFNDAEFKENASRFALAAARACRFTTSQTSQKEKSF